MSDHEYVLTSTPDFESHLKVAPIVNQYRLSQIKTLYTGLKSQWLFQALYRELP